MILKCLKDKETNSADRASSFGQLLQVAVGALLTMPDGGEEYSALATVSLQI